MPFRAAFLVVLAACPVFAAYPVLALAQDGAAVATDERLGSVWSTLEVPIGSFVDLTRGVVTRAAPDGDQPHFRGPSEAFQGNVELFPLLRDDPVGPSRMIGRATATAGSGTPYLKGLAEGDEALWVRGDRWGYVRLLEHASTRSRIEVATPRPGAELLLREPALVRVETEPGGFLVTFDGGSADDAAAVSGPWLVERRVVGDPAPFEPIATIEATRYFDETAPRGRLLEWRVSRAGAEQRFGATARALRAVHPGEWPLPLVVGQRIDLLTGALDVATAHVEVTQVSPPTVVLKPLGATLLNTGARQGSWTLPERMTFDPAFEGRLRAFALGNELHALTPEGVQVRLDIVGIDAGGVALVRQVALNGERSLPRAPELASLSFAADGLDVRASPLTADVEWPEHVALVVERELAPDRNDWVTCDEGAPGVRTLNVPQELVFGDADGAADDDAAAAAEALPLVRVRVRQRYAFGATSFPSEPRTILRLDPEDTATRERLADEAIAALEAPEWERRDRARRLLEALGPAVFPRLEVLLASGTPEAQRAARAILMAGGAVGGRELLLAAEGRLAGLESTPPTGLLAQRPAERAYALVSALETAERRVDLVAVSEAFGWAAIVARFDDDAGVRGFSDMLVALRERGLSGGAAFQGDLAALVPSAERVTSGGTRGGALRAESTLPLEAHVLLRELERHPWLAQREIGPVLGALLAHLRRAARGTAWPTTLPDYDVESVDLTLRLVERYVRHGDARLLDAARGLFVAGRALDWELALEGWRASTAQRLADERAPRFERGRVVLTGTLGAAPGIVELEAELANLRQSGWQYVDLVLPPGDYGKPEGGHWIDLDIPGLRLLAGPGPDVESEGVPAVVRITSGVRVMGVGDVVLDGVRLEHRAGAALMVLDGAHVVVRGGAVLGMGMGIQAQDSDLELYGSHVGDLATDRAAQWSVRHLGRGRIVARGTLFTGGSVYVGDFGEPYFERCVFDTGERPVLQAQREGRPIVRECLMRSTAMGLVNVSGGCLAAVVLDVPRDPFGPRPDGLAIDPRWFALIGAGQSVPRELLLERSPLEGQ
jgi:hypothetical protein